MSIRKIALLICDLQSKTVNHLYYKSRIIENTNKLLYMKQFIPDISFTAISEFIPEKLGKTDNVIKSNYADIIYRKTTYSMATPLLIDQLNKYNISDIILTGMETQWCINKTINDLNKLNYKIHIPVDCIGNQISDYDNIYNIENLKQNGGLLTTTYSFLYYYDDIAVKEYLKFIKKPQ
jgi:hypothetical protein